MLIAEMLIAEEMQLYETNWRCYVPRYAQIV